MSVEVVLKRIACMQHKQRVGKINRRAKRQQEIALEKAAFEQSKIPEMWAAISHIEIPNPAPEDVDGVMVPLKDLKVPWSLTNHTGVGLELYDRNNTITNWTVSITTQKNGGAILTYRASGLKLGFCDLHNTAEKGPNTAEIKFVETFVKWLARKIPTTTLIDLGIDFNEIVAMEKEVEEATKSAPKRKISRV